MPTQDIRTQVALALEAVNNKKAEDVTLLQLPGESSTFTDYFLICSGSNPRQVQAIADEVEPNAREGYQTAEWILLDYVDFVVHIFNTQRRAYYDLERLWKSAHKLTAQELLQPKAAAVVQASPESAAPVVKMKKRAKKATGVRAAAKQGARGVGAKKPARKAAAKKTVARKPAVKKKTPAKKAAARPSAAKKVAVKKTGTKRK
jgi:ribosome-associated protein